VLASIDETGLQLQCVRLIVLAWGDYHFMNPVVEVHTGYSLQESLAGREPLAARVREAVRRIFPSARTFAPATGADREAPAFGEHLNTEASRLLAMLEDNDPQTPEKVASFWTRPSSPTQDLHYLIVLSRLRAAYSNDLRRRLVHTLLSLHRKLEGKEQRVKQVWNDRLSELATVYLRRDPRLAEGLIQHPEFVNSGHVNLALTLPRDFRLRAAQLYLQKVLQDQEFPWSGTLIELLDQLPLEQTAGVFRAQWSNFAMRDGILLRLGRRPESIDRDKFFTGLESNQNDVVLTCLKALNQLPADRSTANLISLLRLLRRLEREPKKREMRQLTVDVLSRQLNQRLAVAEKENHVSSLEHVYAPVFRWVEQNVPAVAANLYKGPDNDAVAWRALLKAVDWSRGSAARGEKIFRDRACQTCHAGARALGPDLSGVTARLARDDLFTAIVEPSRDVAPAYRTTAVETRDGQVFVGIIIFESAEGLIVQTGAVTTIRLATADIVSRFPSNRSLMPDGLLKDLKSEDLADLYGYLQSLKATNPLMDVHN
jgi:putative heme-binding domain-containing protein